MTADLGLPSWAWPLVGALLGLIAGSFLATIAIRWPQGRSALAGRSACDACGARLGARELVPLLSYVLQRGRCRRCSAAIDRRHLAVEIAAAAMGAVALAIHPAPLGLLGALFGWWLLLLAILDLEHHWLPDRLTLPLIPAGLAVGWLTPLGAPPGDRLLGTLVGWGGLVLLALAYRSLRGREGLGGGDPKLLAGLGAWLGVLQLPFVLLGAGLIGLAFLGARGLRGQAVVATTRLPLGTLMAMAAWPLHLLGTAPDVVLFGP